MSFMSPNLPVDHPGRWCVTDAQVQVARSFTFAYHLQYESNLVAFSTKARLAAAVRGQSWFSPSIALPILIGLGLDYDIFYTEKVAEECEEGHSVKVAAARALSATANLISAAGAIMVVAFLSVSSLSGCMMFYSVVLHRADNVCMIDQS